MSSKGIHEVPLGPTVDLGEEILMLRSREANGVQVESIVHVHVQCVRSFVPGVKVKDVKVKLVGFGTKDTNPTRRALIDRSIDRRLVNWSSR